MKTILFLFGLSISFDFFGQSTTIPDANFEQALVDANIDTDGLNGAILNSDAEQLFGGLDVSNKNIDDLTGIAAFTNLTELICSNNNLTTLDLSANNQLIAIAAFNNNLVEINLNNLQALSVLDVHDNQLDSLNFIAHPDLWWLMCYTNNLTYLNISSNSNLGFLSCGENQLTGNLDISNLYNLEFFVCRVNQLSSINIGYFGNMSTFNCQNNNISELDLSTCYYLENVYVDSNELFALNIKNGMNNDITDFRAEGNPNLYCIQVDDSISSTNNLNWIKDSQSYYSEECDWADISEMESLYFNILPNPATDWISIKIDFPQNNYIELSDINGKILLSQIITKKETTIDLRDLSNGTYLIKIDQSVERFIKN